MLVSQFNFDLPRELIAISPAKPRDTSRLLVIGESLEDLSVKDITSFLKPGDIMVFNDTKVIPARIFGSRRKLPDIRHKQEQKISSNRSRIVSNEELTYSSSLKTPEISSLKPVAPNIQITLHKYDTDDTWRAFAKPARKLAIGDVFQISEEFFANVLAKEAGEVTLKFNVSGKEFFEFLDKYGVPPLPPYIERQGKKPSKEDFEDYQTIYAKNSGAVAAPTAGLHFTPELLSKIDALGVKREFLTLHVGAGTFLPMKVEDTVDHKMHSEYGEISIDTASAINNVINKGGRVIAVGTTSLRLLESATDENGIVRPFKEETNIFITPGYKFKCVDMLITNFHLPESTLFMLVSAFCGLARMQAAYQHAIEKKYRFYSYGDACLLLPSNSKDG